METIHYIYIGIMLFCVMMSAYFSATETAFSSLNRTKIRTLAEKGKKKAKLVNKLLDNYDSLISTILIGNNIVNITAASLGTVLFVDLMGDVGATVSTAVITVVVLIFGEITPKSVAKDSPEKFAMFSAPLIRTLIFLFTPLNLIFSGWKKLVSKIFKVESDTKMSQEELLMLVEEVEEDGSIDEEESNLLKNAIEFSELKAEDILTHRVDIEAVSTEDTKEEIARVFTETKFSRLPVYEETIDRIVGIIHQKDFYYGPGLTDKPIKEVMTSPIFVLKSEPLSELLRLLQENKSHVAVVLDEYGGTLGIVTLEDILEELVGEIWDEHDEVTEDYTSIGENLWLIDCLENLDDFAKEYDLSIESESISVGGWVMEQMGKIPDVGDSFEYDNVSVTVTKLDGQRVSQIKMQVTPKPDTDEEE
ncbi:MAG: HlyC/CorC family transporter [Clostridia bacterium]|nr:HlyC/CorC family transporter [Clostridia bacterium]